MQAAASLEIDRLVPGECFLQQKGSTRIEHTPDAASQKAVGDGKGWRTWISARCLEIFSDAEPAESSCGFRGSRAVY